MRQHQLQHTFEKSGGIDAEGVEADVNRVEASRAINPFTSTDAQPMNRVQKILIATSGRDGAWSHRKAKSQH